MFLLINTGRQGEEREFGSTHEEISNNSVMLISQWQICHWQTFQWIFAVQVHSLTLATSRLLAKVLTWAWRDKGGRVFSGLKNLMERSAFSFHLAWGWRDSEFAPKHWDNPALGPEFLKETESNNFISSDAGDKFIVQFENKNPKGMQLTYW